MVRALQIELIQQNAVTEQILRYPQPLCSDLADVNKRCSAIIRPCAVTMRRPRRFQDPPVTTNNSKDGDNEGSHGRHSTQSHPKIGQHGLDFTNAQAKRTTRHMVC
ncbi:hypothetical protein L202_08175 [Cryptococcus amylolentus CBS 6039]|uniref:Uncharacterized protein n=1 Tax=Cryptococcus amylolentus CBS 6039 TaxID=1295533 RepID=A0A1E3H8S7_9TREE|nr:hypothetical protein L202_08175 [Cryptococcus amylolentus CBS 6039]ODN72737.1 hypothetical protein L202_08175 [Cryptococcus amylolentus CBS 6039]